MAKRKSTRPSRIHLLDVGEAQYGDCLLCEVGGERILIDGGHQADFHGSAGHPPIPEQIRTLAGTPAGQPTALSLLIISHAHADHVGCVPAMVEHGLITAEWALLVDPNLAWSPEEGGDSAADGLLAALREEPRYDLDSPDSFEDFADGVAQLQGKYRQMIATLKAQGTKVVLHGTSPLAKLEKRFASIGLKVLGPTRAHLRACADRIHDTGRDFLRDATDALSNDGQSFEIYRALRDAWAKEIELSRTTDAREGADEAHTDAARNLGPVINLQSSVFVLDDGTHRFLFSGDAQLEQPEISDPAVDASIRRMFKGIRANAPYDFVKLGHHGSHNAFGDELLSSIGEESQTFGICTGANSRHHPSRRAIDLLTARAPSATWARTDRNGAVTFAFSKGTLEITKARGRLNDATVPMGGDVGPTAPVQLTSAPTGTANASAAVVATAPGSSIEISIPYVPGMPLNLSVTLNVSAAGPALSQSTPSTPVHPTGAEEVLTMDLGAGRDLPPLLFITHPKRLAANIGSGGVAEVLSHLREKGHVVAELSDISGTSLLAAGSAAARAALAANPQVKGVVILGGYDVIPAQRRDAAPGASDVIRSRDQEDRYIVWSDALYADTDEDGLAELPVSRIPDGKSAKLLISALNAPACPQLERRHGLRNAHRSFADKVYQQLAGPAAMIQSHPHPNDAPAYAVCGDHVYLMLHGDYEDATRFWGELSDQSAVEALHIDQIRLDPGAIVFTGCCWGALSVLELASGPGWASPTPRTTADSIALRCLSQRARAFVGCTGMHYSPRGASIDTVSGPLHEGFWRRIAEGLAPAQALFEAKAEYIAHPTRARSNRDRKIFEQFTVLGLGW